MSGGILKCVIVDYTWLKNEATSTIMQRYNNSNISIQMIEKLFP